ncbi:AbrB/MazE/SpoVT family DNA-binding domain-containing protein [Thermus thalpophilus]|uniref:AbrB/MazE/SpoVT family DNA-binding domain-containing protein n=1 Tax=Thermus thalpophilus TaxID=2908147 RepID=UPI001FAB1ABC|nr:AbrB/MazE/SpoVT family DNA-binding domain-containing protein [Thermus thalpophilus]
MALIARISSKGQATIPKRARQALGLKPGDLHLTELEADGSLRLRQVAPSDLAYLKSLEATFSEWASLEDEEAYRDLGTPHGGPGPLSVYRSEGG